MDTTTEAPAAAPVSAPVELSLDEIIAAGVSAADASGAPVVQEPKAATEAPPTGDPPAGTEDKTPEAAPAGAEPEAEEPAAPPADDITARRVRMMLADVERRTAELDAREARFGGDTLSELLKSPKAFLAKHGKSIDDVIDASIAEGKDPPAPAADDNPRLTALEKRIAAREQAEADAAIANRKAEIHREVTANSAKYPALVAAGRQSAVTDLMVEYHQLHGKPISWDKAAAMVEKDLTGVGIAVAKKLGWNAPAAKPAAPAAPATERTAPPTIGGDQRTAAPVKGDEPEDPEKLLAYLVAQAGL